MASLATMTNEKADFKIVEDGGKKYILASQAVAFAQKEFKLTAFRLPSYRTLRYYVTEGILERPLKLGKETYFEIVYITNVIRLMQELASFGPNLKELKRVVPNVVKHKQFEQAMDVLAAAKELVKVHYFGWKELMEELSTKRPSDVRLSKIEHTANKMPW